MIMERVVHPAHIPLEVEAQRSVALFQRAGDVRPGGGLLGDHQHIRVPFEYQTIELAQEGNGLQIFMPAVLVGDPVCRAVRP